MCSEMSGVEWDVILPFSREEDRVLTPSSSSSSILELLSDIDLDSCLNTEEEEEVEVEKEKKRSFFFWMLLLSSLHVVRRGNVSFSTATPGRMRTCLPFSMNLPLWQRVNLPYLQWTPCLQWNLRSMWTPYVQWNVHPRWRCPSLPLARRRPSLLLEMRHLPLSLSTRPLPIRNTPNRSVDASSSVTVREVYLLLFREGREAVRKWCVSTRKDVSLVLDMVRREVLRFARRLVQRVRSLSPI